MSKKTQKAERSGTRKRRSNTLAKRDPWGCMAGTVTFMPGVDLTTLSDDWKAEEVGDAGARPGREVRS
jgi:hypothetical protein